MLDTFKKKSTIFFAIFLNLNLSLSFIYGDYSPRLKTDDELASSLWTDHVNYFEKLFALTPIDSFLEFGIGEGTYYFLQHCSHVRSVELLAKNNAEANERYYNACLTLFQNFSNWNPSIYRCSNWIAKAVDIAETGKNPVVYGDEYMKEINALLDLLFAEQQYDLAFVDPGIVIRGSFVQALFGRTKIIVAHDTSFHGEIYGWAWIPEHPDYEKISFYKGSGTTFWIHKELSDLIEQLKRLSYD